MTEDETTSISFGYAECERLEFIFPSGGHHSDDWLHPTVKVLVGQFSGTAVAYCDLSDFARLLPELQRLYDTLRGSATFTTIEGQIGFTLTGDGLGHIALSGFLKNDAGGSNRLNFSIDFDQTLLVHSISETRAFLAANSLRL